MASSAFDTQHVYTQRIATPEPEPIPAPTEPVGRYLHLVLAWEDLTERQAQYDQELKALQATGDKLRTDWEALATEHRACLADLRTLEGRPLDQVLDQAWLLFKAHLARLCTTGRSGMPGDRVPWRIEALAKPLTRNPRLTE